MSSLEIYVQAASKKALNERLASGEIVRGESHSPWGSDAHFSDTWETGTIVKIFSKRIGSTPYAKAYGVVKASPRVDGSQLLKIK